MVAAAGNRAVPDGHVPRGPLHHAGLARIKDLQLPSNGFSLAWARWVAIGEATAQAKATTPTAAAGNRRHQMFDMSYLLR